MNATITGTVCEIGEVKTFPNSSFTKRDLVVSVMDGEYEQLIPTELHKDRTDLADSLNVGDEVTVHYNMRGRKWISPSQEVKYFLTLVAWKIDVHNSNQPPTEEPF